MRQVRPKKNLGQHFLTDLSIAKRIADTVDACPDLPVLEVGPGMGVLTQYLMEKPRPLKVVEIDSESVEYLKGTLFRRYEVRGTRIHQRKITRTCKVISHLVPRTSHLKSSPATSSAWTCGHCLMGDSLC